MTKEQIKALIAANIAGQGTQVDLGGALPTILEAIIDAIPEGGNEPYIVQGATADVSGDFSADVLNVPAQEFARAKEAFLAGRVVLIPTIDHIAYQATAYSEDVVGRNSGGAVEGLSLYARSSGEIASATFQALISQ